MVVRFLVVLVLGFSLFGTTPSTWAQEASPTALPAGTDWPTFRGSPARTGVTSDPGPAGNLELRWRHETGLSNAFASPAVAGGVVFSASGLLGFGAMVAIDLATGRQLWAVELPDNLFASSPAVAGGAVYAGGFEGNVFALDAATGAHRWQIQLGAGTTSSPAVMGDTVYIGADDDVLYALDAATGAQRWTFQAGSGVEYIIGPSPAVDEGVVLVASGDLEQDASLFALDAATGVERWRFEPEEKGLTTPAISDGVVYVGGDGTYLYVLNLTDGDELWRAEIGRTESAPAVSSGMVFAHTWKQIVALDAVTGTERWRAQIGGVWSAPAVAGGIVYVGSEGLAFENGLFAFDAVSGSLRWQLKGMGSVFASPAIVGDAVIASTKDGAIYTIGDTDATGPGNGRTSTGALVSPITFASAVDDTGALNDPAESFPAETASLYAGFDFLGVTDGSQLHVTWLLDGEVLAERDDVWNLGTAGAASESISANAGVLPAGTYEIVISLDGEEVRRGSTTIGV